MDQPLPSLFVSHGSPMIALEPGEAGAFMGASARRSTPPSAGRGRSSPSRRTPRRAFRSCSRAPRHAAIYDFGGFDPKLRTLRYDAPGDPALAARMLSLLHGAGIDAQSVPEGGLDHGAWTALRFIYPDATIPVVPLAFVPGDPPERQFALGAALAPLAGDGVLVLGSGSITHNLRRVFGGGSLHPDEAQPEIAESAAFRRWIAERAAARDWAALFAYRARAPHAADMHPTDEHLLPWYVAAGAAGRDAAPAAPPRQRDDGQPRHGRLRVRTERRDARRGARLAHPGVAPAARRRAGFSGAPARCRPRPRRTSPWP